MAVCLCQGQQDGGQQGILDSPFSPTLFQGSHLKAFKSWRQLWVFIAGGQEAGGGVKVLLIIKQKQSHGTCFSSADNHWLFSLCKRLGDLVPAQKSPHQGWFQPQRAARETWQAWSQTRDVTLSFVTQAITLHSVQFCSTVNNQRQHVAMGTGRF